MRNEPPKVDSISQVKLRAFPVLVSILLSITTYMVIEVRSDVKALLTGKAEADLKIHHLEVDVERLNNRVFYEEPFSPATGGTVAKPISFILSPSDPPDSDTIPSIRQYFLAPASIQYEKRKYIAHKGKA